MSQESCGTDRQALWNQGARPEKRVGPEWARCGPNRAKSEPRWGLEAQDWARASQDEAKLSMNEGSKKLGRRVTEYPKEVPQQV